VAVHLPCIRIDLLLVIRRILHILCSLWLVTLLLFGTTPMEAVHALADHCDTVHQHDVQGQVMDMQHHHCQFLGFQLMPFEAPPVLPVLRKEMASQYISFLQLQDERAAQQAAALRDGRGPPAA
jgi:hypothetical protein